MTAPLREPPGAPGPAAGTAPPRDTLPLAHHLDEMRAALVALVRYADRAGPEAPVPTCPGWRVRDLLVHQGVVHRWATAAVAGRDLDARATGVIEAEGREAPDVVAWLRDGALTLARALHEAPDSVAAPVFLADAPPPRRFWARRQCHETTMHAVDALAASLGRYPRSSETWIDPAVAMDGIDELLTGFLPRPRSRLRADEPMTLLVLPGGPAADRSWLVRVGRAPARVSRRAGTPEEPLAGEREADVVLRGSAVALYLALWNRSDEVVPERRDGGADPWEEWRGAGVAW